MLRDKSREPNFAYLKLVLEKKPTPRPVLFDFIIGEEKTKLLAGNEYQVDTEFNRVVTTIKAFDSGGYDFAPIIVRGMEFPRKTHDKANVQTKSLNDGTMIKDKESLNNYQWPDIKNADFSIIEKAGKYLHKNAKFVIFSHDGILENTIGIIGFDNLCYLLYDEPEIVEEVFYRVGKIIDQYYTKCLEYDEIGAIICNDDWGFNTATMLPPRLMRKHVFPWYRRIVERAHQSGRPAILHSCGYYYDIIDDVINNMKFDGRQSYEDNIVPVEKAYEELHPGLAVLGGIDVDFMARSTSDEVYHRCKRILEKTKNLGGYALGSGNSIPDYIPNDNYIALLRAALED